MYQILPYSYQQAKRLGVFIRPSENLKKKIDVYKDSKKVASIGDPNYQDFAHYLQKDKTLANERRRLYKIRHQRDSGKVGTPGYYSDRILW
jgi:hypothetical protein